MFLLKKVMKFTVDIILWRELWFWSKVAPPQKNKEKQFITKLILDWDGLNS